MRRSTAVVLVSVVLLLTAAIVGAYFLTHETEPSQDEALPQQFDKEKALQQLLDEEKDACLEAGGTWIAGTNADEPVSATEQCEHSDPTTAAPVVASPSSVAPAENNGGGGANDACFLIFEDDCSTARNVRHQVYKITGQSLHMSLLEIVILGRATCRALGPNSTDAEVLNVAANVAQTSDIPQSVALPFVASLYVHFCGRR